MKHLHVVFVYPRHTLRVCVMSSWDDAYNTAMAVLDEEIGTVSLMELLEVRIEANPKCVEDK